MTKYCKKCNETKSRKCFGNDRCKNDGKSTVCKKCRNSKASLYRRSESGFINQLFHHAKHRHKIKSRGEKMITIEQLRQLPQVCSISGVKLVPTLTRDWQMSLDRIDDSVTYTSDNSRLICLEFNTQMKWTPEKFQYAFKGGYLEDPTEVQDFEFPQRIKFENGDIRKNPSEYTKYYKTSLKGSLRKLLWHATRRAQTPAWVKRGITSELTFDILLEKYVTQKGKCAYSDIVMRMCGPDWPISVERVNVHVGYTSQNTILICGEFNAIDRNAISECCTGWNIEKVKYMRGLTGIGDSIAACS